MSTMNLKGLKTTTVSNKMELPINEFLLPMGLEVEIMKK